ncbi:MAG: YiiX/YebB-like N1pC/P60 family cysteine hydrolase [Thiomonas sp.]|jgi:hypothetical protein
MTPGRESTSRRRLLLSGAAVLLSAGGAWAALRPSPPRYWQVNAALLQPGDLLFRRTVSLQGLAAQAIDAAGRFSHVGLVVGHGAQGEAQVVHACPPEHSAQTGVRLTTARAFVDGADVRDAAAARLPIDAAQAGRVAAWALQHVGWAFNADFRLGAPHALYCTELVWAAMRAAGCRCLPQPVSWRTPLGERAVVPMSALIDLPGLHWLSGVVHMA